LFSTDALTSSELDVVTSDMVMFCRPLYAEASAKIG
jgi:hypothetical protein